MSVIRDTLLLNAAYVVGPAQLHCGWSDVIIHTCSQFLPACCTAQFEFQCTYSTHVQFPICLFFDLPSHLLLRHLESTCKARFLLRSSGLWEKNSCTNNRCALRSQATTSIFKEWYVPKPLTRHNKGDILTEHLWSFVQQWIISPPSCVSALMETSHPKSLLRFRFLGSVEGVSDRIMSVALPTATLWQMSMHVYVCACLFMPPATSKCPIQVQSQ